MKRIIETDDAAAPAAAYSQGTTDGALVFTAGQVALGPDGEDHTDEDVETQTEMALDSLLAILAAEGLDASDVLKTTVYLSDIDDYAAVNEVYGSYFDEEPPARSAFAVDALPLGAAVEIEAVATRSSAGTEE